MAIFTKNFQKPRVSSSISLICSLESCSSRFFLFRHPNIKLRFIQVLCIYRIFREFVPSILDDLPIIFILSRIYTNFKLRISIVDFFGLPRFLEEIANRRIFDIIF
ncbi:hypothetical protein BpHYR1_018741 [Brachionus plicatilis]|uniref:Uncharacterized protein n=1 Tax=Brachionus plicatilis TaxID=10195 RepID=A0A3M7R9T5_BRAPC|nr:hypothetical protein BpHYR1_018741 [Brachionus plicatilis]